MRRILIGDVHGCKEQLVSLINKLNIQEDDELIFLGDYTDRGPDAYGVFEYLKCLKESMEDKMTILYGNHEVFAIEYAETAKDFSLWSYNGGKETLSSFNRNNCALQDYANFMKENAAYFYECDDFFAAHAGLLNEHPSKTAKESLDDLLWDRMMFENGFYNQKLAFVGHTPLRKPTLTGSRMARAFDYDVAYELPKTGLLGIDTGCFRTGVLTAAIVCEKKVTFLHS